MTKKAKESPLPSGEAGSARVEDSSVEQFSLRRTIPSDLDRLFEFQKDPEANWMAAFTSKDPTDREAYMSRWKRILDLEAVCVQTVLQGDEIVGSVLSYVEDRRHEVSYWIGREYWGRGYATKALQQFLTTENGVRPIFARCAKDNASSRRVLEKCGFEVIDEMRGFAPARGEEIDEILLELRA